MKELEALYIDIINEATEPEGFSNEKNVSSGLKPDNSGPEGFENDIDDPIEADLTVKEMSHEDEKDDDKKSKKRDKRVASKQNNENTGKTRIVDINTNMSDKNVFDKLPTKLLLKK